MQGCTLWYQCLATGIVLTILMLQCCHSDDNVFFSNVYDNPNRLHPPATYFITAPSRVRPNQVLQVFVTVFKITHPFLTVTASVRQGERELCSVAKHFFPGSSSLMQMRMPPDSLPGNYTFRVEGSINDYSQGRIFMNETGIEFYQRQVSIFIQPDRYVYNRRQWISFRVYGIQPNLLPIESGTVDIFVKDPLGRIMRRWLGKQLLNGFAEDKFWVDFPAKFGIWTIQVIGFGHEYKHTVKIENLFPTRFDVNLTMPGIILDNEYALQGTIMANITANYRPVVGNLTITLEIREPSRTRQKRFADWITAPEEGDSLYPLIVERREYFKGVTGFSFPLDTVREYLGGDLAGVTLFVYAEVKDWFFGQEKTNKASCLVMSSDVKLVFLGGTVRTFKPLAPFYAYIAVQAQNGQQLPWIHRRQLRISRSARTVSGYTKTYPDELRVIPDDSIVRYQFTPEEDDEFITVRVMYDDRESQWQEMTAYRHYTERNHYITVSSSTQQPRADTYIVFTVRTTTYVSEIYYQILSKGDIVSASMLTMTSRQKTFSLALSRAMVPSARIVVHCVLGTGEVLADSLQFRVQGVRNAGVVLNANQGKDFSEHTFEVNTFADPGTFVTFAAADRDLYQRGAWNFLTEYLIEEDLLQYDSHANGSFRHTWWTEFLRRENVYFTANSFAVDANTTFAYAGLLAFTDGRLERPPAIQACNESMGYLPCFDGSCYEVTQHCDGARQCEDGADEMGCDDGLDSINVELFPQMGRILTHYDTVEWMWHSLFTKPEGRLDLKVSAPLRPSVWMIQAVTLSPIHGIAFNEIPYVFDVTRPFYAVFEVPPSAFRGEQLGIQMAMYNFWTQPLETVVTIVDSEDYRFVHVEEFGIVSSYNPRTSRGDHQVMIFLEAGEERFVHFPILPVKTGKIAITIEHYNFMSYSRVTRTISISYDGVTNVYHTPYLIDLINSGSIIIPDLKIPIPERFVEPEERYHLYVPGSETATVSVVGDVMGPGIIGSNMASWSLLGRSSGQGESYIFDLAIDLYWLRFLKISNQLDTDRLVQSLHSLNKDLTVVYSYMKEDGSFAMFRGRSERNIWITSFALEVLSDAVESEWEYLFFIDIPILNKITLWLCAQQNKDTGSWAEIRHWYDRKMVDPANMTDSAGYPLNISLTAYATAALSKARRVITGEAASEARSSVEAAAQYLADHLSQLWEPFQICLVAYALTLANHNHKDQAFTKMRDSRREGSYVYWSEEEVPGNPFTIVDTINYLHPRQDYPHECKAVQATGYALMVYIWNNWYYDAIPIMKWLQTMRNVDGGFASTQDTVVAIQALSEFAFRDTNRGLYTMKVSLYATATDAFHEEILLSKGDFVDYHRVSVPEVFGSVRSSAQGTGYALLQLTSTVHVEYPWQIYPQPVRPIFDLSVPNLRFSGRNSSEFDMRICTRWLDTGSAPRSGLTMLEVDIPTGFVVNKQILRDAERAGPYDIWKRSRFTRQKVYLHLDYITPNETCFEFHGLRWYPVANSTIQHKIRIYELHQPANHNTTLYTTYNLFHNHICLVCGSYQCPYCPYYNTAMGKVTGLLWALLSLSVSMFFFTMYVCWRT